MTDFINEKAPTSTGERQDALSPALAGGGTQVALIPADRLYRLAALAVGIFLLVSMV